MNSKIIAVALIVVGFGVGAVLHSYFDGALRWNPLVSLVAFAIPSLIAVVLGIGVLSGAEE